MDLSRIEAKKKKLFFEKADIVPHLESVVLSMRPNAKENVNILFTHKEPSITVVTDLVRLQQVVINLIGNAIKFTDNGSITLDVENRPDEGDDVYCRLPIPVAVYLPICRTKYSRDSTK